PNGWMACFAPVVQSARHLRLPSRLDPRTSMKRLLSTATSVAALATFGVIGCSSSDTGKESLGRSESAQHAWNTDAATRLLMVTGPDGSFPVLATNHAGYRLECASDAGRLQLIRGAGFDPAVLPTLTPLALNSPQMQELVGHDPVTMLDLRVLTCSAP